MYSSFLFSLLSPLLPTLPLQMDPQSFFSLKTHLQNCIFLIVFTTLAYQSLSLNPKFQACEPKSCGNGPDISYPFRLPDQETYCGFPNFDVACQDNNTVLTISDDQYIIKDIFPGNHSFLVANAVAYNSSCPAPLKNVSLALSPFNIVPGYLNFSIFYGCDSNPPNGAYLITCGGHTNDTFFSFASFDIEELKSEYSLNSCLHFVNAPVCKTEDLSVRNYTEILQMGFMLNWTAPNCISCVSSGGRCGFEKNEFVCFCREGSTNNSCGHGDKQKRWRSSVTIVSATASVVLLLSILLFCAKRKMLRSKDKRSLLPVNGMAASNVPNLIVYSLADIEKATDGFSFENKLGEGGYGPVYKGMQPGEQVIAVKKLSKTSRQGFEEFKNEVMLTASLQHVNLVKVLGFCIDRGEQMLIYEYMPNKSLDYYLFDPNRRHLLDWQKRVEMIEGITQGLLYLQEYSRLTIIHRDLKASNILLDKDMKPKISDFGMARTFAKDEREANTSRVVGTYGYVPPEYVEQGVYSIKSDVYSFGVLLLQVISGKRNACCYGLNESLSLLDYAYELWTEGKGMELMDSSLDDRLSHCKLITCLQIALLCVQQHPIDRPSMLEVSSMLKNENADMKTPKLPAFSKKIEEDGKIKRPLYIENVSKNEATISEVVGR